MSQTPARTEPSRDPATEPMCVSAADYPRHAAQADDGDEDEDGPADLRPLSYAYVRTDLVGRKLTQTLALLARYAESRGLLLAPGPFTDEDMNGSGLADLISTGQRSDPAAVIIPSPRHLSQNQIDALRGWFDVVSVSPEIHWPTTRQTLPAPA